MRDELEPAFELAADIAAIKLSLGKIISEVAALHGQGKHQFITEIYSLPKLEPSASKPEAIAHRINETLAEIENIAASLARGKQT